MRVAERQSKQNERLALCASEQSALPAGAFVRDLSISMLQSAHVRNSQRALRLAGGLHARLSEK